MKKLSKLFFKFLIALIVVFLLASLFVAFFVDINRYKGTLVELVEEQTGLNMAIDGDLSLSIISGLKFHAEDVRLSHDKVLIADIELIDLGMTIWSLYVTKPEVTSLDLVIRELHLARDKKGNFNFLPLLAAEPEKKSPDNDAETEQSLINNLSIRDISVSLEQFSYMDDLASHSLKLEGVEAALSMLPVIDHYDLVVDDPRVLVGYSYSGQVSIKQALSNQYQISDLSLSFKDKQGDLIAEQLSFNLVQRGKAHSLPPLRFSAKGALQIKLAYDVPEGASEPQWNQPDLIKVGQFEFNLPEFRWADDSNQVETKNAHLKLEEVAIFEGRQFVLDNLLIHSLSLESQQVNLKLQNQGDYSLKNVILLLNEFPVVHKGQLLDFSSDVFLKQFAQQGKVNFSSDNIIHNSQGLEKIKLELQGRDKRIKLSSLSFNALESKMDGTGHMSFEQTIPQWNLRIHSEQLNLQPISSLINMQQLTGHISVNNQLSGTLQDSDFKVFSGKVRVNGNNIQVTGMDLDKILNDFQSTQSVGLLDVGAVALLGPAGVVVSKGNDYRNLSSNLSNQGKSKVTQLNSEISFANDIANMDDVAFATEKHLWAVRGKIDLKSRKFLAFEVATIDPHGCPIYLEEVTGTLDSPTVKKSSVLVSGVINPISSVVTKLSKTANIKCDEPFYSGIVKVPQTAAKK